MNARCVGRFTLMNPRFGGCLLGLLLTLPAIAADAVFSGPQPSEKATPFKVVVVGGPKAGQERDPISEAGGAPTALVFVHGIERSLVPLLRVIDEYGGERQDKLRTEVVFL